jgi:hypothetical protein
MTDQRKVSASQSIRGNDPMDNIITTHRRIGTELHLKMYQGGVFVGEYKVLTDSARLLEAGFSCDLLKDTRIRGDRNEMYHKAKLN